MIYLMILIKTSVWVKAKKIKMAPESRPIIRHILSIRSGINPPTMVIFILPVTKSRHSKTKYVLKKNAAITKSVLISTSSVAIDYDDGCEIKKIRLLC
jgi:hypothetical protein